MKTCGRCASRGAMRGLRQRPCGARHRLEPTRVPRSRNRDKRGRASPGTHKIRRILHVLANTSRSGQGHTDHAPSHSAVSGSHCRHSRSRRPAPPLRPHCGIAVTRRPSSATVSRTHLSVEHVCVAVSYANGRKLEASSVAHRNESNDGRWSLRGAPSTPYSLFECHRWDELENRRSCGEP